MSASTDPSPASDLAPVENPPLWQPIVLTAMAGGMAWGIRGQYGHETGAMMSGLLMGFVLMLLFCRRANSLAVARAIALCTVAIGFGGSETYAQSVGLTHDAHFHGNFPALLWGMTGLAVKGAVWVGFGGAFLGLALGGVRYRSLEMLAVMLGIIGLHFLGVKLLNQPFDPDKRILPTVYFSHDWKWANDPDVELKPRPEIWGGLVFALTGLIVYAGVVRRDAMCVLMGFWGILGGAVGFPSSQIVQAWNAWNPEFFREMFDTPINWWNFMETEFGCVMGAFLGLGLWIHRRRIALPKSEPIASLTPVVEWSLLSLHIGLLVGAEFFARVVNSFYAELGWTYVNITWFNLFGYCLGLIPIVAIVGGRWWPYLQVFLVTAIPITGKTVRHLIYEQEVVMFGSEQHSTPIGWAVYLGVPLLLAWCVALFFARRRAQPAKPFLVCGLTFCTWLYFTLNYAFFRFPWPWEKWTGRTPNAIVFAVFTVCLTLLALSRLWSSSNREGEAPAERQ